MRRFDNKGRAAKDRVGPRRALNPEVQLFLGTLAEAPDDCNNLPIRRPQEHSVLVILVILRELAIPAWAVVLLVMAVPVTV